MCDFADIRKYHNCFDPLLPIKVCEICQKKTCGWTRAAFVSGGSFTEYTICSECSRTSIKSPDGSKKYNEMIERHRK